MDPSGKSKGPPPAVKKVLSLVGSGKEEDTLVLPQGIGRRHVLSLISRSGDGDDC